MSIAPVGRREMLVLATILSGKNYAYASETLQYLKDATTDKLPHLETLMDETP